MHLHEAILLGAAAFFLANAAAAAAAAASSLYIVNGESAEIANHPYQASLREKHSHFCGATIISERHILTAAHCIVDAFRRDNATSVTVHTGTSSSSKAGRVHRVAGYAVHPEYSDGQGVPLMHDIAVVTLKDCIRFDRNQRPAKLPLKDVNDGEVATITGWGIIGKNNGPDQLQKLDTTVITAETCRKLMTRNVDDFEVCAFKNKLSGVCYGDSGGPLVADDVIIGVSSWIEGKFCAAGHPDVYAKVYTYLGFIRSVMRHSIDKRL